MRLLILALLGYLLYRVLGGLFRTGQKVRETKTGTVVDEMVQDPLCKIYIPKREARRKVINGQEYFFCSEKCYNKFLKK